MPRCKLIPYGIHESMASGPGFDSPRWLSLACKYGLPLSGTLHTCISVISGRNCPCDLPGRQVLSFGLQPTLWLSLLCGMTFGLSSVYHCIRHRCIEQAEVPLPSEAEEDASHAAHNLSNLDFSPPTISYAKSLPPTTSSFHTHASLISSP